MADEAEPPEFFAKSHHCCCGGCDPTNATHSLQLLKACGLSVGSQWWGHFSKNFGGAVVHSLPLPHCTSLHGPVFLLPISSFLPTSISSSKPSSPGLKNSCLHRIGDPAIFHHSHSIKISLAANTGQGGAIERFICKTLSILSSFPTNKPLARWSFIFPMSIISCPLISRFQFHV